MDTAHTINLASCFPALAGDGRADPALAVLHAGARELRVPPATPIFHEGAPCERYLLVVAGSVRVFVTSAGGREVTLYRVEGGQSCVLTTSCLLGSSAYPAAAVAETEVCALAFDAYMFRRTMDASTTFRSFVFAALGERLASVIRRLEELNFGAMDRRIAAALLAGASAQGTVRLTHQQIAEELGTAREVVSRHLGRFAARGWVALRRGTIVIQAPEMLATLTRKDAV